MPLDIFWSSFTNFTILCYADWVKTQTGIDTISPGEQRSWTLKNLESQEVMVTVDVANDRMAERGCNDNCWIYLSSDTSFN